MKRNISLLLVLALLFTCFSVSVSAQGSDEVISFDYYYLTLRDEYAKYGIDFRIENTNSDAVYTQQLLEQQLAEAKTFCESISYTTTETPTAISATNISDNIVLPQSMPVYYYWTRDYTIRSDTAVPNGYLTVEVYCYGYVDIQNGYTISATAAIDDSHGVNVSVQDLTPQATLYSDGGVSVWLNGSVQFEWTGPLGNNYFARIQGPFLVGTFTPDEHILN